MTDSFTVVFGASGHGKVVCDILLALKISVAGFIDGDPKFAGREIMGLPVLGDEKWLAEKCRTGAVKVALGIGDQQNRKMVVDRCKALGAEVICATHPNAVIAPSARLGRGTVVTAGAIINPDADIGTGVIINTGAIIEHDVVVGEYSHVSPGAVTGGGARIGSLTHVGLGAIILPRVVVGDGVTIGAGSVVLHGVPDNVVAYGVPAKIQEKVHF
jgi:sugar O-acyltransferase (sialic acid O-acetyltransferase NeuD family)